MTSGTEVFRYSAFTADPLGGNPAGVVLDAEGLSSADMQQIAAEVGYSETAFMIRLGANAFRARYFSPAKEVPFCGHATIATAIALAERTEPGEVELTTSAGPVRVTTGSSQDGVLTATLTSVPPTVEDIEDGELAQLLEAIRWGPQDMDPALPVRIASAGARHPIVAAATRERLAALDYDFDGLAALMDACDWTTVDLVWRESPLVFHVRNPFPIGGVVEDPATGSAAAALGGYLRALRLVPTPSTVTIHQGADLGRPSLISVDVPAEPGSGIRVSGGAVRISA